MLLSIRLEKPDILCYRYEGINLNTVDILRFHEVNSGEEKEMFI